MHDLYDILKVSKGASLDEIKKSYRKLALDHHPDRTTGNEEEFKKINEAYAVLSDSDKRKMYDQFGTIDGNPGGGVHVDLNDILKNMFGGGMGMGGMGSGMASGPGFSFMFVDGNDDSHPGANMFEGFPGFPFGGHRKKRDNDTITVEVDVNDIYYGNTKRVEFEILDLCDKCNGTGAHDPSHIVTCITCNGQGSILQQLGPFVQKSTCGSCGGKGSIIKNNKLCGLCKGEKVIYSKKIFELKIPKGIPNNHEIKMEKKGAYNLAQKSYKDMIFKFKYKIEEPYSVDDYMNVTYVFNINIEELLGGFQKTIKLYKDDVVISSDMYFNPTHIVTIKDKGFYNIKKQRYGDLYIKFNIIFTDGDRLIKYNEVLQKIIKKNIQPLPSKIDDKIRIQDFL